MGFSVAILAQWRRLAAVLAPVRPPAQPPAQPRLPRPSQRRQRGGSRGGAGASMNGSKVRGGRGWGTRGGRTPG